MEILYLKCICTLTHTISGCALGKESSSTASKAKLCNLLLKWWKNWSNWTQSDRLGIYRVWLKGANLQEWTRNKYYLWTVIHCTKQTHVLSLLVYHAIMFSTVWMHFCLSLPNSFKYVLFRFTYFLIWNIIRGWAIGLFGKGSNCLLSNDHMKLALEGSNLHKHVESLTQKKVLLLKKHRRKTVSTGESTDAFYCSEVQRVWSWERTAWSIKPVWHTQEY